MNRIPWPYLLVVFAAAVSVALYSHHETAKLQRAQNDSCTNYEMLKAAVNDFHGSMRHILTVAIKTDETRAKHIGNSNLKKADLKEVAQLKAIKAKVHIVTATCAQKQTKGEKHDRSSTRS